jgi:hypothetical protein|tara:strand:- start:192 stop:476 length:285 start_codon:yes stop_codon:yes gene_type:complete
MKYTVEQIKSIVKEEIEEVVQSQAPSGAGSLQIKKAEKGLQRIKNVMVPVMKSLENLGLKARVNFALHLLTPLNLQSNEIIALKSALDKQAKEK